MSFTTSPTSMSPISKEEFGRCLFIQFDRSTLKRSHEFYLESIDGVNAKLLKVADKSAAQIILSIVKDNNKPVAYLKSTFPGEYLTIDFSYGEPA